MAFLASKFMVNLYGVLSGKSALMPSQGMYIICNKRAWTYDNDRRPMGHEKGSDFEIEKWKWKLLFPFYASQCTFFSSFYILSIIKHPFEVSVVVVGYFGDVCCFFVNMLLWHIRSEFQMKMKKFSWNLKRNKNCFRSRELFSLFLHTPLCLSIHTFHYGNGLMIFFRWLSSGNLMEWLRT
jgi:hypothetical protein